MKAPKPPTPKPPIVTLLEKTPQPFELYTVTNGVRSDVWLKVKNDVTILVAERHADIELSPAVLDAIAKAHNEKKFPHQQFAKQ